jgi:pheromone shutdown protein TraB
LGDDILQTCENICLCLLNRLYAGERDDFMAEAVASSAGVNLVGVVGMAHMGGIERYLTGKKGFSVVMRNCPVAK